MGTFVRVSVAVRRHSDQTSVDIPTLQSTIEGGRGRNLETGTEVEAIEEHCLLACSSCLSQLYYTIQEHHPRGGGTHSELGSPSSIPNQNMSHRLAYVPI